MTKVPSTPSKPVIVVDIDDVLAAGAQAFIDYSNQKYGTHLTIEDYQDSWDKTWGVNLEETHRRAIEYHQLKIHAQYPAISGALEVLKQLKKHFTLKLLTTRRDSINQLTRDWINQYYPNIFSEIVFTKFFVDTKLERKDIDRTKGELARELGASYLIDDQLKNCLSAADNGIEALLFGDYPWNRSDKLPAKVTRVSNWAEVSDYFGHK